MADPAYFPPPHSARIGMSDVEQLESQTRSLRSVDYQFGGGACRDAVIVRIYWAQQLLAAEATDAVRARLLSAVADLHNLAGWTSFDCGQVGAAYHHFDRALDFARHDEDLTTNIVYRRGRVHLHHGAPGDALAYFQRGAFAPLAASIMHLGPVGAGMGAKIVVNAVMHAVMVVLIEASTMATKLGLPMQTLVDILKREEGLMRPLTHRVQERIMQGNYAGGMSVSNARKDSVLAIATAQELGIPLYAILASHTPYEIAEATGMGNLDYASLATLWEQWTGAQLSKQE